MKIKTIAITSLLTLTLFSCGDSEKKKTPETRENPFEEKQETKKSDGQLTIEEVTGKRVVDQYKKAEQKAQDIKQLQLDQLKTVEGLEK